MVPGQEEHCQGTKTMEAAQGATEGPKSGRVPVRMARRRAGVAGTAGAGVEAGPGWNGAISSPSPQPATHDPSEEGCVRVNGGCRPVLRAVDTPPRVPDEGTGGGETVEEYFRAKRD